MQLAEDGYLHDVTARHVETRMGDLDSMGTYMGCTLNMTLLSP